jgi:hypothetical protein
MKKKAVITVIIMSMIWLLTACGSADNISEKQDENTKYFEATVLEIQNSYLLVEVPEDYWCNGELTVPVDEPDDYNVGDYIGVHFYGEIMETYPGQINKLESIEVLSKASTSEISTEKSKGESTMENELDSMMGFDELGLYYEVHMVGIDGENFNYSVYFEENFTDEKLTEVNNAITEFLAPYNDKDIYLGYIDVSKNDDKLSIYLDLGNTDYEYQDTAIKGILKALNNIQGIKSVIVNENCDFDF